MVPILYSFRRCPYAIRARMALIYAGVDVELREILLRNKPVAMLEVSPKGTVPVLVFSDGSILDESYKIMCWAIEQNDPDSWHKAIGTIEFDELIQINDGLFKKSLDYYKYSDRYPENSMEYYRSKAEFFLLILEQKLLASQYLLGPTVTLADVAVFPFIRQFSLVEPAWFDCSPYANVRRWLKVLLDTEIFHTAMKKQVVWEKLS